jgi:hypothetical protein
MRVVEEEVQGPLLAVAPIDTTGAAVAWINHGTYRLSASIWSGDVAAARRLAHALDVGQVWINDQLHPVAQPEVTLVGRGASGFGAARGLAGLMEMVQPKVISETPRRSTRRYYVPTEGAIEIFRATVAAAFARGFFRRGLAIMALLRALIRHARAAGGG